MKRRGGGLWFLTTAILAGILAAVLAIRAISDREVQVRVYEAEREIAAYTPLEPRMFRERWLPRRLVTADVVQDLKQVEGRYARTTLLPGEVIREGHLASTGAPGAVAARLTEAGGPEARALALSVDAGTGVGGTILAGDRVDVVAAVKVETTTGPATPIAKVIAAGVPVLYVEAPGEVGRKGTVVLQVTPAQAEEIAFAQMVGTIYLATNPYNADPAAADTPGVTPERFLSRYRVVVPDTKE